MSGLGWSLPDVLHRCDEVAIARCGRTARWGRNRDQRRQRKDARPWQNQLTTSATSSGPPSFRKGGLSYRSTSRSIQALGRPAGVLGLQMGSSLRAHLTELCVTVARTLVWMRPPPPVLRRCDSAIDAERLRRPNVKRASAAPGCCFVMREEACRGKHQRDPPGNGDAGDELERCTHRDRRPAWATQGPD